MNKNQSKIRYHYYDNWSGAKREFTKLNDAKKMAKKETGHTITILDRMTNRFIFAPASGNTPN
jgi:hypothetical protein